VNFLDIGKKAKMQRVFLFNKKGGHRSYMAQSFFPLMEKKDNFEKVLENLDSPFCRCFSKLKCDQD